MSTIRMRPIGWWDGGPPRAVRSVAHSQRRLVNRPRRQYATESTLPVNAKPAQDRKGARYNAVGVQQLSENLHKQLFPSKAKEVPAELVKLSQAHLSRHQLLGKNQDQSEPIDLPLPPLHGATLDEHFYKLGKTLSEPWLTQAKQFAQINLPQQPRKWQRRSGWTKYHTDGSWEAVEYPDEQMLTFDVEVMWKESNFAVMACAAGPKSWYAWLSPWLLEETEEMQQLTPLGDPTVPRIVVGHNIGYDRARIREEYNVQQTKNFYLDTMSLHVAVNGMCSQQRPTWMRHMKNRDLRDKITNQTHSVELAALLENGQMKEEEEELWVGRSSVNSLRDVAKFHCDITIDKAVRDSFGELDRKGILAQLDELLDYCAADVSVTHKVYKKVFPGFLETCPHPISFGALRHLSTEILPIDKTWNAYLQNAEATYLRLTQEVEQRLKGLLDRAVAQKDESDKLADDPWLGQLDWSGQEIKMVKGKKKGDPPRPAARQKMPGMPQWYKDLFASSKSELILTVRTRISPILLRLAWNGNPLVWSDTFGWTFKVQIADAAKYEANSTKCDMSNEKNLKLKDDTKHVYFKLPHKDGPEARCTNPLAKGYLQYFDSRVLSSEYEYAKQALEMNSSCSYWISARDRIMSQMAVFPESKEAEQGFILPQVIPMGTITRRAVENTWLTASNAKANRVGSELKAMIRAPPGHHFVGADVDSEELWIAALVGDSQFRLHGGNALGFMTLEGTKAAGTEFHSTTAKILGISRNNAKVFNYGRIYGAGLKFAAMLLRQFNPSLSEKETNEIATRLYKETKGSKTLRRGISSTSFWRGGTESLVFNMLETFAEHARPRTPVLGAGITEALMRRFIDRGAFMTSRINWAIQSSGVDYLHLLIMSMDYLIARYGLQARLALTVHDEIRYLVKSEDRYKAAMALQVANIWTRSMFSQQMGIDDLPQSCAFFSAVDIDHVLRKEVDMNCVTPSHPDAIAPGESLDINALIAKGEEARLVTSPLPHGLENIDSLPYTTRTPVMEAMQNENPTTLTMLKAQIANDEELKQLVKEIQKTTASSSNPKPVKVKTKVGVGLKPQEPILPEFNPFTLSRALSPPATFKWGHGSGRSYPQNRASFSKHSM